RAAPLPRRAAFVLTAALVTALAACSGGGSVNIANSQRGDPATVDFPIFYVKRTVPKNAAGVVQQDDLRVLRDAVPSADLFMRATASPSATETNITARLTAGASWDVKDVDTSADGAKVAFAMRGPLAMNQDPPDLLQPEPRPRRYRARERPRAVEPLGSRARQGRHAPVLGQSRRDRSRALLRRQQPHDGHQQHRRRVRAATADAGRPHPRAR